MRLLLGLSITLLSTTGALAQYRLMGEMATTAGAGTESAIYNYDTHANVLSNTYSSWSYTQVNWDQSFHTAELAHDGRYRLMGETDTAAGAGLESAIYTYDTYSDLLANNYSSWSYTQVNWDASFRTVGLTYDGQYRLMGETDTTAGAGLESAIYTYDTYADLLANNYSSWSYTQIDWYQDYHTAGLAFDGKYRLLGETATTAGPGLESTIYTYDTYADLLANNYSSWSYTQIDWYQDYHTAGYEFEPVPEPATLGALGLGLASLLRRRRKQ